MDLTLPFRNVPNGRDLERVPATFRTATIYRSWQLRGRLAHGGSTIRGSVIDIDRPLPHRSDAQFRD